MKKILQEFKQFAMRGNVVDMAVGIIIGGAFGKIVSSIVADLIMPAVGLLVGGVNFTDLKITLKHAVMEGDKVISPAVSINYGNFIQVTLDFIIIAFAVFLLVKGVNALSKKKEEAPKAPAAPPADIQLLTEIQSAKPPVHLFKTKRFYFEVLFQNEASLLEQNQTAFKWTSNPI